MQTFASLTNGRTQLQGTGISNLTYVVQASTNLTSWTTLLTTNAPVTTFIYDDKAAANLPRRFYRALMVP